MSEQSAAPASIREQLQTLHGESFAWALVCCAHEPGSAEDALQMTYLKILDGRARFEGRSAFKTWLFGVIRMTVREQRRRTWWSWLRAAPVDAAVHLPSAEPLPDRAAERSETRQRVLAACARLSARQRQVMMLVFYHDLVLDEAAKAMGVSPGSARKHYQRGKEQLRAWLGPHFSKR